MTIKLIVIAVLLFFFIVPTFMVRELIEDRSSRKDETITEVSSKWGRAQNILGPILVVPYRAAKGNGGGYITKYAYFLPENLNISGEISTDSRSRGIYDVTVYEGPLSLSGKFNHPNISSLGIIDSAVIWDQVFVTFGLSDMRGVKERVVMQWNDGQYTFLPGPKASIINYGMHTLVPLSSDKASSYSFSFNVDMRGTSVLSFVPVGKETKVELNSDWPYPSFDGSFLPVNHSITDNGFEASWQVLDLNRSLPQYWTSDEAISFNYPLGKGPVIDIDSNVFGTGDLTESAFGVRFYTPVDLYQKSLRSAKYAMAVITLVFVVFFLVEVISKRRVHPVQYVLIGLALVIFYTLLLSIAEYLAFGWAYLIASTAIVLMITLFSKAVMKSMKLALVVGAITALLYCFIYILIQMKDFTLLLGSVALFIILAIIMYVSRYINWYGNESNA